MYVCVCNAVTEGQVRQAINEGALTTCQVRQRLDAERVCGSCDDCLEDCLAEAFMLPSLGLAVVTAK
jgi:bacterioferritin-associated ferredoxin